LNDNERQQATEALAVLCAVFGVEATSARLAGYLMALDDIGAAGITEACRRAATASKFMPRPVELRELVQPSTKGLASVNAWSTVTGAMSSAGVYRSVRFADPAINATIRNMGGWVALCGVDSDELNRWKRKDFERIYGALSGSQLPPEQTAHLPGISEAANGAEHATWNEVVDVLPFGSTQPRRALPPPRAAEVIDLKPQPERLAAVVAEVLPPAVLVREVPTVDDHARREEIKRQADMLRAEAVVQSAVGRVE
jgi:hypothetical protein